MTSQSEKTRHKWWLICTDETADRYEAPFDETIVELLVDDAIDAIVGRVVGVFRSAVVFSRLMCDGAVT